MIDPTSLFKISYGLFLIGAVSNGKENACITNTVMQITSEPIRCVAAVNKASFTHKLIMESKKLSVSVLDQSAGMDVFQHFGMQSGYKVDKFGTYNHDACVNGCPVIREGVCAIFGGDVYDIMDVGTHTLFLFDITGAETTSDIPPMTYADYRILKSGQSLQQKESVKVEEKWVCTVCHYEYDGEIPFEELPDDYRCPICGVGKEYFVKA